MHLKTPRKQASWRSLPPCTMELFAESRVIEAATGLRAKCNFMAMQQGDVPVTFADTSLLRALTGFAPKTLVEEGVNRFVAWYRDYFGV
jgi:UDP-glucuronate 4-epimerase